MAWLDLRAEIAAEFRHFGASVDAVESRLTVFTPDRPHRREAGFTERVEATARTRREWTAPELREALGVGHDPSATKRVGKAMRELGWFQRRKHGGLRLYSLAAA